MFEQAVYNKKNINYFKLLLNVWPGNYTLSVDFIVIRIKVAFPVISLEFALCVLYILDSIYLILSKWENLF